MATVGWVRHCIGYNWLSAGSVGNKSLKAYVAALVVDYLCLFVPFILSVTVLAEWTFESTIMVLLVVFLMIAFKRNRSQFLQEVGTDSIRANLTSFRVSMGMISGYQALLWCGLNKYLLSEERATNIFSQNKEGIYSILGYWGMYLLVVRIGSLFFFGDKANAMSTTKKGTMTRVWALCLFFWLTTLLLDRYVESVSRRMCNMAYVSFVLAFNLQVSDFIPGFRISALEEAFTRSLLASFLLANVLTGLVNLSIDTLSVSPVSALAILFSYGFILSIIFLALP